MHLLVHLLDVFRHDNAFTWAWYTWIGNVSAGIIIFLVVSMFWPRARHAIERFLKKHLAAENAELHRKLDHIIQFHPDIPPLPPKENHE